MDKFWARVTKTPTCWLWTGAKVPNGYGQSTYKGTVQSAHRVAWISWYGPVPEGLLIDHACHNRDPECAGGFTCAHRVCCNPLHLRLMTNPENAADNRQAQRGRGRVSYKET